LSIVWSVCDPDELVSQLTVKVTGIMISDPLELALIEMVTDDAMRNALLLDVGRSAWSHGAAQLNESERLPFVFAGATLTGDSDNHY